MSETSKQKPHLVAVPDEAAPQAAPAERVRPSRLPWVWAAVAAVAGLGWLLSWQQASALRTSLSATRGALVEARAELGAYQAQNAEAQDRVGALLGEIRGVAGRLSELETLLATPPSAPPEPPAGEH